MSDRPTTHERLIRAVSSTNLSLDPERRGDADYIVALGLAARATSPAASALMRLHLAGTPADFSQARQAVIRLVEQLGIRKDWPDTVDRRAVADLALAHHLWPACPSCLGRGYELIPGTPHLSAVSCRHCHGTGRRPVQRRWRDEIRDAIASLEQIDVITTRAVSRLIR